MTLDRSDVVINDFTAHCPPGCDTVQVNEVEWLERFPGGFTPISKVVDGNIFQYDPAHIAATTEHLNDDELGLYLIAITAWWWFSYRLFTMQWTGIEILSSFTAADPESVLWLSVVASHNNSTLIQWVGATGMDAP